MSYQCIHNKLADKHAELAREFQGFGDRLGSQTARLNAIDASGKANEAAVTEATAKLTAAERRIAALEGELATMRLALCEIRKAQHVEERSPEAQGADREWVAGEPGQRRAPTRVSASLLRATGRTRQDAEKGRW